MYESIFWAGDEASYSAYTVALARAREFQAKGGKWWLEAASALSHENPRIDAKAAASGKEVTIDDLMPLYNRQGAVGVIDIFGTLVAGSTGFYRLFGVLGYDDIKSALLQGVQDKDAKSLMLAINSPGGQVAGARDAARFVSNVSQVKPTTAYTGTMMGSAATWIGTQASYITADETAIVGSIGIMQVLKDVRKAMEQEGIKVTIMRSGKYKNAINPYEELTEEAKAMEQAKLDEMYGMFAGDVASGRGTTYEIADKTMGEGRTFLASGGLKAGLIDAVGGFDAALAHAGTQSKLKTSIVFSGGVAASSQTADFIADNAALDSDGTSDMTTNLTKEQLAALAAGASLASVTGTEPTTATADVDSTTTVTDETVQTDAAATDVAGAGDDATIASLTSDLSVAQTSVTTLTATVAERDASIASLTTSEKALSVIVAELVGNRAVALNRKVDTSTMDATQLVAAYNELDEPFKKAFRSGGSAANTLSTEAPKTPSVAAVLDPLFFARAASLKPVTK